MMSDVKNLIDALANNNKADANGIFNSIMADRMRDLLDAKKIEIGTQLYATELNTAVDADSAEDVLGEE